MDVPQVKFGELVENAWASENNPTRRGYFVRAFNRTGKLNPGLTWEITDGGGKFWTIQPRHIGDRLTVTPADAILALPTPEDEGLAAELRDRLREISDMLMGRPDMLKALQPLMGPAEKGVFDRCGVTLARADHALSRAHQAEPGDGGQG